jgi:hypothetical protein
MKTPLGAVPIFRAALRTILSLAAAGAVALSASAPALASGGEHGSGSLSRGGLLVSRSEYQMADIQPGVTVLPPGCVSGCATANTNGAYPYVFNNDLIDASFGVTSPILLDQITPSGSLIDTLEVPTSELVTSFSSKSELALNLSTSGRHVTFMGYAAPVDGLDVSNSNTPGAVDATNPVSGSYDRVVATLDPGGRLSFTETNAYSGNNGRAAILNDEHGHSLFYTAGNAGNGSSPQPDGIILGAGAQILAPSDLPEAAQSPGVPTPLASFNVTQLGDPADKIGKDDNFRGLTIFDHVLYYTKGSGSNGVDTVYFVDTTGSACPSGTGIPAPGAELPSSPLNYDPAQLQTSGLPSNMCVLSGFPTTLAKSASSTLHPFGIWFANARTVYVADEGDGSPTYSTAAGQYTDAASQTTAGLQKWIFDAGAHSWKLAYTLQNGLALGQPYTVRGYPTGDNSATGLPWAPATDGLRNVTGRVNRDGTATIWAITSTVSGSGDQGADPNKLVRITDSPSATSPGAESFDTVRGARFGQVVRGVAFAPGT